MNYRIILYVALIVFIVGDLLMLLIWFVPLFLGVGIPAYAILIWLLIVHSMSIRSINARGYITKSLLYQQLAAGLIITVMNFIAVWLLNTFSELMATDTEPLTVLMPSVILAVFSILIMYLFFMLARNVARNSRIYQGVQENNSYQPAAPPPVVPVYPAAVPVEPSDSQHLLPK